VRLKIGENMDELKMVMRIHKRTRIYVRVKIQIRMRKKKREER